MRAVTPLSEDDFLAQILDLAALCNWETFHVRPARTAHGWRTATQGTMAKGWPDLVLLRTRDLRLLFVELKRDGGKTTPDQNRVLDALVEVTCEPDQLVRVWRPKDWAAIEATLR